MVQGTFQSNEFWPLQFPSKDLGVHWDSNSQNGSPFGSVGVHSLTLSYTPGSMKYESWDSLLACTFASPCLAHKPKVRVAIVKYRDLFLWQHSIFKNPHKYVFIFFQQLFYCICYKRIQVSIQFHHLRFITST